MNWLLDFNYKTANATSDFIYFSFLSFCFVALGLFLFSQPLFFLLFLLLLAWLSTSFIMGDFCELSGMPE